MDELKKNLKEVKDELDKELDKINDVNIRLDKNAALIKGVRDEQRHVSTVHKEELDSMEECVKQCQISIAQHDERLKAYEANSIRQNGTLEKLSNNIVEVGHGVNEISKKVDAMDMSIANRMSLIERNGIGRDNADELAVRDRESVRDKSRDADISTLSKKIDDYSRNGAAKLAELERTALVDKEAMRVEFIKSSSEARSLLMWKIISGISAIAFLFFVVIITIITHTFGGLP